jgi:periplasmic nitrate reductase NapD
MSSYPGAKGHRFGSREAKPMEPEPRAACLDISGIVVHAAAGRATPVRAALERIEGVTVHAASPAGKLVATLETESEARSVELFERIRALEGVQAVAMVYHQIETDPDQEA